MPSIQVTQSEYDAFDRGEKIALQRVCKIAIHPGGAIYELRSGEHRQIRDWAGALNAPPSSWMVTTSVSFTGYKIVDVAN